MRISKFEYIVEPWIYAGPRGGEEKTLRIRCEIDGILHQVERVMTNQQPFENEIEHYTRIATEELTRIMRSSPPLKAQRSI